MKKIRILLLCLLFMSKSYAGTVVVTNNTSALMGVILSALNFGFQDTIPAFSSKTETVPISTGSIFYAGFLASNNGISCQGTMMINQTLLINSNTNPISSIICQSV